MNHSALQKSIIQESYNQEAERYRTASMQQQRCFTRILELARDRIQEVQPRFILDAGCGGGLAIPFLKQAGLLEHSKYLVIDLSPEMIVLAKRLYEQEHVRFSIGDIESMDMAAGGSACLVVANAMLHWLNQPKLGMTPDKAFHEIYRVLRTGGLFIMSACGTGKARRIRQLRHGVLAQYQNVPGFNPALYVDDPLGCFDLYELVYLAKNVNLKVEIAELDWHSMLHDSPLDYTRFVRAYGFNPFLAPLPKELREEAWSAIEAEFVRQTADGPYLNDFYVAYLIASKPPANG